MDWNKINSNDIRVSLGYIGKFNKWLFNIWECTLHSEWIK